MNGVGSVLILALLILYAWVIPPSVSTSIPPVTITPEDTGAFRFDTNTQILIIVCCFVAAFVLVVLVAATICIVRRVLKSRPRKTKGFREQPPPIVTNETPKVSSSRRSPSISKGTPNLVSRSPTYNDMINGTPSSGLSPPTEWIEPE